MAIDEYQLWTHCRSTVVGSEACFQFLLPISCVQAHCGLRMLQPFLILKEDGLGMLEGQVTELGTLS